MENKWTRGPWMVTPSGYRVMWVDKTPSGEATDSGVICDTATNNASRTKENAANAKLIAKAPELFQALYDLHLAENDVPLELHERVERILKEVGWRQ